MENQQFTTLLNAIKQLSDKTDKTFNAVIENRREIQKLYQNQSTIYDNLNTKIDKLKEYHNQRDEYLHSKIDTINERFEALESN